MNQKQKPRWGRAIGTTILGCAVLSLAATDTAKAAVLTYNFTITDLTVVGSGFFKFNNSSLTGIGTEKIAVSEGRFNTILTGTNSYYGLQGKDYYDLIGTTVSFFEGEFRGLQGRDGDYASRKTTIPYAPAKVPPPVPVGPFDVTYETYADWFMESEGGPGIGRWFTLFTGYRTTYIRENNGLFNVNMGRIMIRTGGVSYTLADTAAEPVPEPITVAGTALAVAGLSWLKFKKKTAV